MPFVAGAYIEGQTGDIISLYRQQMDVITSMGGTPILFQTARLHGKSSAEKIATYQAICKGYKEVLGFELGKMFAPNGEIFDTDTVRGLMAIPEMTGMKHSSLDRLQELERLSLRDSERPDFRIYTGNDLGINMIEYGSDYLLGLATFAPEKFAERDRLWELGDPAYYALSDALQYLGNICFPRSGPCLQALRGCVSAFNWENPLRRDTPEESTPARMGSTDSSVLCATIGTCRLDQCCGNRALNKFSAA